MITLSPDLVSFLGATATFVLLAGLWYPAYTRSRDLRRRAGLLALPSAVSTDLGGRRQTRVARRPAWEPHGKLLRGLGKRIEMAGLDLTPGEVVIAMAILGAAGGLIGVILGGAIAAVLAGVAGGALPLLWIRMRHGRRQRAFLRQLPDAVALLAGAVRAGHSLMQGLEQVAKEAPEPTRGALEQVVREIGFGAPQDEALERLGQRFWSQDLDLIITSIGVQQQVGGSLGEILDEMSETLRERERINGEIAALTAPQKYSAYVLALLPVFVTITIFLISREYMQGLFEGVMRIAAAGAGLMVLIGFLIMRKIATVNV